VLLVSDSVMLAWHGLEPDFSVSVDIFDVKSLPSRGPLSHAHNDALRTVKWGTLSACIRTDLEISHFLFSALVPDIGIIGDLYSYNNHWV
jgi:hypothetical protein